MSMIEHKGYEVMQVANHHVWIGKDNKLVLHANCEEEKTDDELRAMVDAYIELTESGKFDEIYNENEECEV